MKMGARMALLSGENPTSPCPEPTTVLIVDDDRLVRRTLRDILEQAGHDCLDAASGEDALKLLPYRPIGVCVCDIQMGELSGLDVLAFIGRNCSAVPVIMLTGFVNVDVAVTAMKTGAFDYLTKPVKKEELVISVRRALDHRGMLARQKHLEEENAAYRQNLERMVEERTSELEIKTRELERVNAELRKANLDSVKVLAEAIEAKDPYTRGHCLRVSLYAKGIARCLNFGEEELENLEYSVYLHDIGKIGVPEAVLNKPGTLTALEYETVKEHPLIGANIMRGVEFFRGTREVILYHHERFDGHGYPEGLQGEKIPLAARIAAVADAYDAMSTERPYRSALSVGEALEVLRKNRGTQFDPGIVDVFLEDRVFEMGGEA